MNSDQKIEKNDIESFLYNLPDKELVIVEYLRELVFECIPNCEEKLSYQVPYYYGKKRICFIWPASIPMSGIDEGVVLGFCKGCDLDNGNNFLDQGSRKEVSTRTFFSLQQALDERDFIKMYLLEASKQDALIR